MDFLSHCYSLNRTLNLCHSEHAQSAGEESAPDLLGGQLLLASRFLRGSFAPRLRRRHAPPNLRAVLRVTAHCMNDRPAVFSALPKNQLDMRDTPLVAISPPLRRRADALHARTVVGDGILHIQIVDLDVDSLFRRQKI